MKRYTVNVKKKDNLQLDQIKGMVGKAYEIENEAIFEIIWEDTKFDKHPKIFAGS